MKLSRRELLTGAAVFAAATALPANAYVPGATPIHPLLPIKPPKGLITAEIIVREAIFQLDELNTELPMGKIVSHTTIEPKLGDLVHVQHCRPALLDMRKAITWASASKDLLLSMDDYAERFITPAMKELYSDLEASAKRAELGRPILIMSPLPLESWMPFAARADWRGYAIRVVRDYSINDDAIFMRLDVLCGFARR